MKITTWLNENTTTLKNKKVAITGPTGDIGKELCFILAGLGANLILLDRNKQKSQSLQSKLLFQFPDLSLTRIELDLEDLNSVKVATEKLINLDIDYIIHNAGAYFIKRKKCQNNLDNIFCINFLFPYYISHKLKDQIIKKGGKIVVVGSIAHNYSKLDVNDIDFSAKKRCSLVYGNAKRFLMASHYHLCYEKYISVTHPGISHTNITAHYPKLIYKIIKYPMKVLFIKPKKAALNIVKGIFTNCKQNEWIGPKIFNIWGMPTKKRLTTMSENESKKIFELAEKMYNDIANN